VLTRWQGGFAAVVVTLATCGLVAEKLKKRAKKKKKVNPTKMVKRRDKEISEKMNQKCR